MLRLTIKGDEMSGIINELIEKAKLKVFSTCPHPDDNERPWLEADIDSYSSKSTRIKLLVLEGSPPRGIIIVNYPLGTVTAINMYNQRLHTWKLESMLYDADKLR